MRRAQENGTSEVFKMQIVEVSTTTRHEALIFATPGRIPNDGFCHSANLAHPGRHANPFRCGDRWLRQRFRRDRTDRASEGAKARFWPIADMLWCGSISAFRGKAERCQKCSSPDISMCLLLLGERRMIAAWSRTKSA